MTKQTINVGESANDRTGDPLRIAFQKTNANFAEIYAAIENIDRSWEAENGNVFDVIEWNSGTEVTIESTPYETANLVTYDSRTHSEYAYFVWNQTFIDEVWEGYNTPAGEGQGYELSFDGGTTWYAVERSGWSNGNYMYFAVPPELQGSYTFTYDQGVSVLVRFNRGSFFEPWFDLKNGPVDSNRVVAVVMNVVVDATITSDSYQRAIIMHSNLSFANVLYDNDTGEGDLNEGDRVWSGSSFVKDRTDIDKRRNSHPDDAGRVYASFQNGSVGNMKFYWNAKLYTVS